MENVFKKLEVNKLTAKITLDRLVTDSDDDLKALSILTGGYNKYGRKISLDKHRENMKRFQDLIEEIKKDMQ